MSDRFTCYPIDKLLRWILEEEKQGEIFGIRKELFDRRPVYGAENGPNPG
jgi:hypothetical protein